MILPYTNVSSAKVELDCLNCSITPDAVTRKGAPVIDRLGGGLYNIRKRRKMVALLREGF